MKINKGFTLMELLAVVVILAIIALIATPTILGVIEKAKKGAASSSALGYIDAVEKQIAINNLDTSKTNIIDYVYEVSELKTLGVNVKGQSPTDNSWVKIEKNQVVDYSLKIGDYVVNYDKTNNKADAGKNREILEKPKESGSNETKNGPTIEVAQEGDTHKGIVYLDPTDLNETCNESNSMIGLNGKCMKWYVFAEDESNYTMILDHNTTEVVQYNSDVDNKTMKEIATAFSEDTMGWLGNPRLIEAEEVSKITNNTSFDETIGGSWFYLDGSRGTDNKWQTQIADSSNKSKYAWLYDYTIDCMKFGCDIELSESSSEGYWTQTAVGDTYVWRVTRNGRLDNSKSDSNIFGIRPVITISKSIFS